MPPKIDHDGYAKRLLTSFLPEFLAAFVPEVLPYTDLSNVTFLDKELPHANPRTKKRAADFVAQVKFRGQDAFFLFHINRKARNKTTLANECTATMPNCWINTTYRFIPSRY